MFMMYGKGYTMPRTFQFQIFSALQADRSTLLQHIGTLDGVNVELRPLLGMTLPRAFRGATLYQVPTGEKLFRSWLLLGGILPIDYDHLQLESVDPESGFVESSTMLSMRVWRHERRVYARDEGGCTVEDTLTFEPRVPGTGTLLRVFAATLFRHRHRKLRAMYGEA